MSKLVGPPPKFIPPEWHQSNTHKFQSAESERVTSERLIDESDRLIEEARETAKRTQRNVENKLDQRLKDLKGWQAELNLKLTELKNETDSMLDYRNRLNRALEGSETGMEIANACLSFREGRSGIDLVHDNPEIELIKEVEVIKGVQELLKRDIEQATEQIRRNRKGIYDLEQDLQDKGNTIGIDDYCKNLHNNSAEITLYPDKVYIEPHSTSTLTWRNFTDNNVKASECERINCMKLRDIIDQTFKTTCDDMKFQDKHVNLALEDRIRETRRIKTKLEEHLAKVTKEIGETEKNITELTKAIEDELAVMMVAQTRLKNRAQRRNVELCRDPAQYALIDEVNEITRNVNRMKGRLAQSEQELVKLTRQQRILEEDIQVKTNTIYIDEVKIGQLRSRLVHNVY